MFVYTKELVVASFKIHALILPWYVGLAEDTCYERLWEVLCPFTKKCVCGCVLTIVLMIGCYMLSQQAYAKIHNPSASFSLHFFPSSGPPTSLFVHSSSPITPCPLFPPFDSDHRAVILSHFFLKLFFSQLPTFFSILIHYLIHLGPVLL